MSKGKRYTEEFKIEAVKRSDYGELIDEIGEVVFKAATTDALEKALRYL
ncbi:hypothetical protein [Reinekea sp.]|jgi:hypothetical protein